MEESVTSSYKVPLWIWIALALVFLSVPILYFFNVRYDPTRTDVAAAWGQFGDFIGGTLNPVLGLFTVVAVLKTYQLQQAQLAAQAKSMKNTAELNALTAALDAITIMIESTDRTGSRSVLFSTNKLAIREAIMTDILTRLSMPPEQYMSITSDVDEEKPE